MNLVRLNKGNRGNPTLKSRPKPWLPEKCGEIRDDAVNARFHASFTPFPTLE